MDTRPIARALGRFWADRKNRLAFLGPLGVVAAIILMAVLPYGLVLAGFIIAVAGLVVALLWCLTRLVLEDFL